MFLFRLHKFAQTLLPLRKLCVLLALAGVLAVVYSLLRNDSVAAPVLRIAIVLTLWSLLLFAFIQLFQNIPAPVLPKDHFIDRLRSHLKLGLYQLLALAIAALGILLVMMSFKLLLL
jgi:hypothetical protein